MSKFPVTIPVLGVSLLLLTAAPSDIAEASGEISGSLRNAFRGSLEQLLHRGRATDRERRATRLSVPTKLRIL
jgi:hypothetical protein